MLHQWPTSQTQRRPAAVPISCGARPSHGPSAGCAAGGQTPGSLQGGCGVGELWGVGLGWGWGWGVRGRVGCCSACHSVHTVCQLAVVHHAGGRMQQRRGRGAHSGAGCRAYKRCCPILHCTARPAPSARQLLPSACRPCRPYMPAMQAIHAGHTGPPPVLMNCDSLGCRSLRVSAVGPSGRG